MTNLVYHETYGYNSIPELPAPCQTLPGPVRIAFAVALAFSGVYLFLQPVEKTFESRLPVSVVFPGPRLGFCSSTVGSRLAGADGSIAGVIFSGCGIRRSGPARPVNQTHLYGADPQIRKLRLHPFKDRLLFHLKHLHPGGVINFDYGSVVPDVGYL